MRLRSLLLCPFLLAGCIVSAAPDPNVVIFFADDLGYGDVGYQGGNVPTPHIDSIAREGVIFTDGYVTAPVCAPSRAGLMTGRYQQSFGFWDNIGPFLAGPDVVPGMPLEIPILSEHMKKQGYVTGLFGKTHGGHAEELMAFNRWDEFFGFNNGASNYLGGMNRPHNPIFHNREILSQTLVERGVRLRDVIRDGVIRGNPEPYLTDQIGEYAVRFITANRDRPFLCYIPFNAPHGPYQAPEDLVRNYAEEPDPERRKVMAMVDSMDKNVGKVLAALRENGLEENTLVVFLSDNGGHPESPNTPLRGKKATFWEGGLRVPFCVKWPARVPAGRTVREPVIALDILPTLLDAAGASADASLDGVSLLPLLEGRADTLARDTLYWVWMGGLQKAIRKGEWKALSTDGGQNWMLFHLPEDIGESRNRAEEQPERLQELIGLLQDWEKTLMPPQWGWNPNLGPRDPDFNTLQPYHQRK